PSLSELGRLSLQAYTASKMDETLTIWRYQGGPSPWVFRPRLYLYNGADEAIIEQSITVKARVKIGELRVDPDAYVTDYAHLESTAEWQPLYEETIAVPVLAPGEDKPVDGKPIVLPNLLEPAQTRW